MSHTLAVAQCVTEEFTKKILRESEVETVLQRLDRLTQEEARLLHKPWVLSMDLWVLLRSLRVTITRLSVDIFLSTCFIRWQGIHNIR
jgi:hypothetical protein